MLNSVEINKEREGFDRRALGDWATPGASTMAADVLPLRPALPSVSLVQAINKKMMLYVCMGPWMKRTAVMGVGMSGWFLLP